MPFRGVIVNRPFCGPLVERPNLVLNLSRICSHGGCFGCLFLFFFLNNVHHPHNRIWMGTSWVILAPSVLTAYLMSFSLPVSLDSNSLPDDKIQNQIHNVYRYSNVHQSHNREEEATRLLLNIIGQSYLRKFIGRNKQQLELDKVNALSLIPISRATVLHYPLHIDAEHITLLTSTYR